MTPNVTALRGNQTAKRSWPMKTQRFAKQFLYNLSVPSFTKNWVRLTTGPLQGRGEVQRVKRSFSAGCRSPNARSSSSFDTESDEIVITLRRIVAARDL